jgi:predicted DCC family thiol-disulfide oxidoreductase YuxK
MKLNRLVLTFVLAPLVAFPVAVAGILVQEAMFPAPSYSLSTLLQDPVSAGWSAIGLAYKMMLFLGLPLMLVLRWLGALRSGPLETAFALLGGLPFVPLILAMLAELPDQSSIEWRNVSMTVILLLIGTLSGLFAGRAVLFLVGEPLPGEEGAGVHHHLPAGEPREVIDLEAGPLPAMEDAALTVLYDVRCPLCRQARSWLASQPKYVQMAFVPAGSREALRRFPNLDHGSTLEELTVIGWQGEVYRGAKGWVMCLWALKKFRSASLRLSTPEMLPVARRLIAWVSRNRFEIGRTAGWTK